MSIRDKNAATVYAAAKDECRLMPPKMRAIADAADETWEAMAAAAKRRGVKLPNDDRAENVVHAMFRSMAEAAPYDVDGLAMTVRWTETAK